MKLYDIFKFSSSDIYALKFLYSPLPIFLVVVVVGKGGGGRGQIVADLVFYSNFLNW